MVNSTGKLTGANRLLAIRRVTQDNKGKRTAGIDGIKSLTPKARLELMKTLKPTGKSKATRRVWIPKPNGEKRPLGIPTMFDRASQALVKAVLEPEWEARFEPNSYGFRPARSCHDAISQIKKCIQHKDKYVLDADIAKCFDRIDHAKLLNKLGYTGLIRKQIESWLKSGVFDERIFAKTEAGTPQGGVISPLLANIALHGMETEVRKCVSQGMVAQAALNFIRYADDFVVMHKDKKVILKCKETISNWLKDIGLELKPEKTRLTHTLENNLSEDGKAGFNFLGFHIQQFKAGKHNCSRNLHKELTGFITLITPTKEKCKEHQEKLGEIIRKHKTSPQAVLIKRLNPLDGNKSKRVEFSTGNRPKDYSLSRHGDVKCSSTDYVKVKGDRSYYDGDFIYWSSRMGKHPETTTRVATLLKKQKGKCPLCNHYFTTTDVIEIDHIIPKSLEGKDEYKNLQLLHGHCHDTKTASDGSLNPKVKVQKDV